MAGRQAESLKTAVLLTLTMALMLFFTSRGDRNYPRCPNSSTKVPRLELQR
jgi:hypothetical protein